MPQATNLVIKNGADVDKTFTLAQPSSGANSALWYLREGANQGVYPKVEVSARKNAGSDGRKVHLTLQVPLAVQNSSGATVRAAAASIEVVVTMPDLVPDSVRDDAIAYIIGLVAAPQIKDSFKVGFAPT